MRTRVLFFCYLLIFHCNLSISRSEETKKNKFRDREATDDAAGYPNVLDEDDLLNSQCPQHLELRWQTEVSSSVYATPLIADINSDGKHEVIVPSFVHYLEVLEGSDGDKLPGWPAFHQSTVHSSPFLYDIDKDGIREIGLATYNGEVLFFRASGYTLSDKLEIPRLKVKKDWHVGLNPDPVDRSHPDVHDDQLIRDATAHHNGSSDGVHISHSAPVEVQKEKLNSSVSSPNETHADGEHISNSAPVEVQKEKLNSSVSSPNETHVDGEHISNPVPVEDQKLNSSGSSTNENHASSLNSSSIDEKGQNNDSQIDPKIQMPVDISNASLSSGMQNSSHAENVTKNGRRLLQDDNSKGSTDGASESENKSNEEVQAATVENDAALEDDADSSFELFRDGDELADEYDYDYDDFVDESMWGDEEWTESQHDKLENYVHIDAHVLSTPVIADIDNDGVSELIVAVSYFFDHEYYDNPERLKELGNIDIGKYVAGGIVVFNLDTKQVKWTAQLDMSTDSGTFRAYVYSSPTVVDLDGDGNMDILIGTSFGLFYILDHKGKVRDKFPLEMAEIQGGVVAADINDDGKIELVTTDTHGNVAAWTAEGKEIWEQHVKSLIPQGPTIGDVDGDGRTEVVVPTVSGNIYVLSGKDGSFVKPYPYKTHGRVMNQVLLVDLSKRGEKKKGLTLVTTSFDGYLYLIDGPTSCADVVDIGETSYSMALADNVDGGDDLDLIVATMNGNVFCFSTPAPHHPLKAWKSPNQGRNNNAYRWNRQGIHITPSSRTFRDEAGKNFWVEVEIVDKYRFPSGSQAPYNVTVSLLVPGNYQGDRTIKQNHIFDQAGIHRIKFPTVRVRTAGTVVVEMVDKNGLHFSDEFALSFHLYYYKLLKWLLVLPMLGMFGILVILRPQDAMPLPSFSRNID